MEKFKVKSLKFKDLKNRILFPILTLMLYSNSLSAQEIKTSATLSNNNIVIGQQVELKLMVDYHVNNGKQIKITWPELTDTLRKEVEIVGQTKVDTIIPDSNNLFRFIQTKTLFITSFDSGYWAIPPFKFKINTDTEALFTEPLLLKVNTVAVDTTMAIKDIKAPFEESYTWLDWIKDNPYLVLGILSGIIVLILIIYFAIKHFKNKPEPVVIAPPPIPAHILALEKLEKLKNEKLWQDGKVKQYHIALSEIIREYIENRFKIQALEQTTDEILFGFRNVAIDEESKAKLKQVLILSDLVKFAKEQPLPTENEQSLNNSIEFINGTSRNV